MTISLKHTFASAKSDGTDSTLVQPSNWNAEHTITLAAGKVLGRDTSAAGAMQELPLAFDSSGNATVSATGSFTPPVGTTAQRPGTPATGMMRYNTSTTAFEGYNGSAWGNLTPASVSVASISFGSTGLTPNTATTGAVSVAGTLAVANGGTGLASAGALGNVLTSNGSAWASTTPTSSVATGTVIQYGSSTTPSGYLKCDGSTYNISSYSALATVLGSLPVSYGTTTNLAFTGVSISYYSGKFLVVGSSNNFAYSSDGGLTWTIPTVSGLPTTLGGVAYNGTTYVTANSNECSSGQYYSTTGTAWSFVASPSGAHSVDVIYDGSYFVSIGISGNSTYPIYSANGSTGWTNGAAPTGYATVQSAATNGSGTIVLATYNVYTGAQVYISTSTNHGATWTSRTVPSYVSTSTFPSCSYTNGLFIVTAFNGGVVSSSDSGVTWVNKSFTGPYGKVYYLAATGYYYCSNKYSTDLITWYPLPVSAGYQSYAPPASPSYSVLATDGTYLTSFSSTLATSYKPITYTAATQFIVPNQNGNGLGNAPAYGVTSYIKT